MNLFETFYSKYLTINLSDYDNIGISLQINVIVLAMTAGLCIGCIILHMRQSAIYTLFKKLVRIEAYGKENATTLKSLGLSDKRYRQTLTSRYGRLKQAITVIGERKQTYEEYQASLKSRGKEKPEESTAEEGATTEAESVSVYENDGLISAEASFYVPEDQQDLAAHILERNSTSIIKTVLSCTLILAIGLTLFFTMPLILSALNSALA